MTCDKCQKRISMNPDKEKLPAGVGVNGLHVCVPCYGLVLQEIGEARAKLQGGK